MLRNSNSRNPYSSDNLTPVFTTVLFLIMEKIEKTLMFYNKKSFQLQYYYKITYYTDTENTNRKFC